MEQIIVNGTGIAAQSSDWIVISLDLNAEAPDYRQTMKLAAVQLQELQDAILALGYKRRDLQTGSFNISSRYEQVQEKGTYRQVFVGYACHQGLSIGLQRDNEKLGTLLERISTLEGKPAFNLNFTLRDFTALREEALRRAVADAKRKADLLCEAAGKKLADLVTISYGSEEPPVGPMGYGARKMSLDAANISSMEMEPGELSASETVEMVYTWRNP